MTASTASQETGQGPSRTNETPSHTPQLTFTAASSVASQMATRAAVSTSSSVANSGTTPRLLFTWDPYRHVTPSFTGNGAAGGGGSAIPTDDNAEEGRRTSSVGCCSTTSSMNNNANTLSEAHAGVGGMRRPSDGGYPTTTAASSPPTAVTTMASSSSSGGGGSATAATRPRPPLTISELMAEMNSTTQNSPHIGSTSLTTAAQQQQYFQLHQSPRSDNGGLGPGSTHSTPSGPILMRIPTTAKDGRQYFLDYTPTHAQNSSGARATAAAAPPMPNLMLPPNVTTVTPSSVPSPQQQLQQRSMTNTEIVDLERNSNVNTSPQVAPLISPPRRGSNDGPFGAYVLGSAVGRAGAQATLTMSSTAHHGSYDSALLPSTATAAGPLHRENFDDTDADIMESLAKDTSVFVARLLPPPPPLPDLARVLTVPGVVQSLCARWCAYVDAALKSDVFAAVTAAPPPPPLSAMMAAVQRSGSAVSGGSTKEELTAWYDAAVEWWERLEQEGTGLVDVRAKSRAVTAAVDMVTSGRARRSPPQHGHYGSNNSPPNGGRSHPQGGAGAMGGYRGRGGRGGAVSAGGVGHGTPGLYGYTAHQHNSSGVNTSPSLVNTGMPGVAPMPASRGGRGTGSMGGVVYSGSSGYAPPSNSGADPQRGMTEEREMGFARKAYQRPSKFNPYAQSWPVSEELGMGAPDLPAQQMQQSLGRPDRFSSHMQQQQGYHSSSPSSAPYQ